MKRIPKGFQMGPHRVTVTLVSEAEMRAAFEATNGPLGRRPVPAGLTVFEEYKIYVLKVHKGFPKGAQMQTFWHEYFHMLLWVVGRERLSRDETLVDTCGSMQLQAFQTAEF